MEIKVTKNKHKIRYVFLPPPPHEYQENIVENTYVFCQLDSSTKFYMCIFRSQLIYNINVNDLKCLMFVNLLKVNKISVEVKYDFFKIKMGSGRSFWLPW